MKNNPVYRRLLRIEITLILFLILCIVIMKSCFGSHTRESEASQHIPQADRLTQPEVISLPEDADSPNSPSGAVSIPSLQDTRPASVTEEKIGLAGYYQDAFHGHPTASGEDYDRAQYTAAHRELPFGTQVRVTNIANGRQVTVRVNDRGPHIQERIIDLSGRAAKAIGLIEEGITQVKLEVLH